MRSYRRVRSAKDDSNREPVGAAAARGGKTHDAHLMEMLRLPVAACWAQMPVVRDGAAISENLSAGLASTVSTMLPMVVSS